MDQIFDKEKIQLARSMLINSPFKRNKFSSIFDLFKDDILKLISLGMPYKAILINLNNELNSNINYDTFLKWIQKNIKQKNQSSNLKNNSQTKKEDKKEVKQDNTVDNTTSNSSIQETGRKKKKSKNWKEVIFPQIEAACEGMRKANLRM